MFTIIDAGNTRIKVALADDSGIREHAVFKSFDNDFKEFIRNKSIKKAFVSSVITALPDQFFDRIEYLNPEHKLPINNKYSTPQRLGADRLSNAVGAFIENGSKGPVLAIDLGTCIKFDVVDNQLNYLGGSISPGYAMRLKSLHEFTAKLPLITIDKTPSLVGDSTENSIASGVFNGIVSEINGLITRYQEQFPGIKVFLTGGDASVFADSLKNNIFVSPLLTLNGLYAIARLNGF